MYIKAAHHNKRFMVSDSVGVISKLLFPISASREPESQGKQVLLGFANCQQLLHMKRPPAGSR